MTKDKEKLRYIFPSSVAKQMKKIDTRTQLEASMMSMFLIMIGMTLFAFYSAFWGEQTLTFKILLIFNLICGWVLLGSYLVTTYQQYVSYMETMDIDPDKEREEMKKKGFFLKRLYLFLKEAKKKGEAIQNLKKQEEILSLQNSIGDQIQWQK